MCYQYGCPKIDETSLPPEAEEQPRLANRFWNKLVEIEKWYRDEKRKLWLLYGDIEKDEAILDSLLAELTEIKNSVKKANQKEHSRHKLSEDQKQRKNELIQQIKEIRTRIKEAKERAYADGADEKLAELGLRRKEQEKAARQSFAAQGLYWGTYNAVAAHYETARKKAAKEGAELRFHRYDGSGTWTAQIQTESGQEPLRPNGLMGLSGRLDRQVKLRPVDWTDWDSLSRSERRKRGRTVLEIIVRGSRGKGPEGWTDFGEPVYMRLPVVMHRPLPPEAEIVLAQVARRKIASHYRYSVSLTVRLPDNDTPRVNGVSLTVRLPDNDTPRVNGRAAAVDLGWRKIGDGLRVAAWIGGDGDSGELRLPAEVVGEFDRVERIRSERDREFNHAKSRLLDWSNNHDVPDWLAEATKTLPQWRSCNRLAAVVIRWRDARFPGDEDIFADLEDWRRHDKHHWEFEANLRDQLCARRREMYRVFAAMLARRYGRVVVEDMDLREMVRLPQPGEDEGLHAAARRYRVIAAPGELRQCVKLAVLSRNGDYVEAPAAMTTRTHFRCGEDNKTADFAAEVAVTCPVCSLRYDQDFNACHNLLAAATRVAE
jgi:hypothetical protein